MKKNNIENLPELQGRFDHTYLDGIFLVVNAIPDAYLLLDAPQCGYDRACSLYATHDFFSDLIRNGSNHRICCTSVGGGQNIIRDRSDHIAHLLRKVGREKDCSAILLASIPMAFITGMQYDNIARKVQKYLKASLIETQAGSLRGDWLDGYDETLLAIAGKLDLRRDLKQRNNVAIAGYLFDRNEGDHTANIKELGRMLKGLSLNLVSVWLSGCLFSSLRDIEKAGTIISFPYGRRAAREISRRTGADLLELDLPFGLENTRRWINAVGAHCGRKRQAGVYLGDELRKVVPLSRLLVSKYFTGRRFAFSGDPYLASAFAGILAELGAQVDHAIIFASRKADRDLAPDACAGSNTLYAPLFKEAYDLDTSRTDMFVGNSYIFNLLRSKDNRKPYVELGFPSFYYHCLTESPFLGARGYINFLNRLTNAFCK
ncbi:MAG: nitrogenase component 1 [Candidatus Omnitrophota bacterium]